MTKKTTKKETKKPTNTLVAFANMVSRLADKKNILADELTQLFKTALVQEHLRGTTIHTVWAENNGTYLDFRAGLVPDWVIYGHEVKFSLSVSTEDNSWYLAAVVDCPDGEIESWGSTTAEKNVVQEWVNPVNAILEEIKVTYLNKKQHLLAEEDPDLVKATEVADQLRPLVEQIKTICANNNMTLWFDRAIDGGTDLMVLPEDTIWPDAPNELVSYDYDKIPTVDLEIQGFDSNYDFPCKPNVK